MNKFLKTLLMMMAFMVSSTFQSFADYTVDGITYKILSNRENTCEVVSAKDAPLNEGSLNIPSTVNINGANYTVIGINYETLPCFPMIATSITLPTTLQTIKEGAFGGCGIRNFYGKFSSGDNKSLIVEGVLIRVAYDVTSYTFPYSVTRIGNSAFELSRITDLTLPSQITSIGDGAFGASNLSNISIPSSVSCIGDFAFSDTPLWNTSSNWKNGLLYINNCLIGAKKTEISEIINVNPGTKLISNYTFSNCTRLKSITIPESIINLPIGLFKNCQKLEEITIPESIVSIGGYAFYGCSGLTSINIPNTVNNIGEYAFYNCSSLTSINLPNAIPSIEKYTFYGCTRLSSIIIPKFTSSIEDYAFSLCSGLSEISIPNSVKTIGSFAFNMCSELAEASIPSSVTKIGTYAFNGCSGLTSISFPNSKVSIGEGAFNACRTLNSIVSYAQSPSNLSLGIGVFYEVPTSCPVFVPKGCVEAYKKANQWSTFENIIEMGPVSLTDGDSYTTTFDQQSDVNYSRNFKSTNWQGLYIPFDMSYEEWEPYATVAELAGVHMYDDDNDGTPDRTNIEFATLTSGKLIPNVPYLIKPKAVANVTFQCTTKNLKAAPEVDGSVYSCTPRWKYSLIGTYTNRTDLVEPNIYSLGQGKFRRNNADVPPFRFYLEMTKQQGGYWGAPGKDQLPTEIEISVDGNTLSGIAEIFIDSMPDCADDNYYDLQGRKVENPSGGIFIHKGKLLLFK